MNKIDVAILGATGVVGQKFVELLSSHPWFRIVALAASERSQGHLYGNVVNWQMATPLSPEIARLIVQPCHPSLPCSIVFSGLESSIAGEIESRFVEKGYCVISNASAHRMHPAVPLLIPEVNPKHLDLVTSSQMKKGMIVTNPNCSVIGVSMALKPLIDRWGISQAHIVTLQSLSGAGYPGVPSYDLLDNVIPFIAGEEEKLANEPCKIFGSLDRGCITPYPLAISAYCHRVPVMDGHMAAVSIKLSQPASADEIISSWETFLGEPQHLHLPSAPTRPLVYFSSSHHPQPRLHRHLHQGMSVSIGRLRPCSLFDWKFSILSHNTIRGAAGGAILNAELMYAKELLNF